MSELIIGIIAGVASGFAVLLAAFATSTFSLSIARALRLAWVRSITKYHSRAVRAARLSETESYISDMEEDLRRQGYTPGQIALRIVVDLARSIPADITWRPQRIEPIILTPPPLKVTVNDAMEALNHYRAASDVYQKTMSAHRADQLRQTIAKSYSDTADADNFSDEVLELIRASQFRDPDDDA